MPRPGAWALRGEPLMSAEMPGVRLERRTREQVKRWREELINLSRTNRLVNFKHTRSTSLEIAAPAPTTVLARLGESGRDAGWQFFFPPEDGEEGVPGARDLVVGGKAKREP